MWERLLLFLPRHYSAREVEFHRQRVLRVYQHIVSDFVLTGYRDRAALVAARHNMNYSMGVLHSTDRETWKRIENTHKQIMKLRKNVFPPGVAAAVVSRIDATRSPD